MAHEGWSCRRQRAVQFDHCVGRSLQGQARVAKALAPPASSVQRSSGFLQANWRCVVPECPTQERIFRASATPARLQRCWANCRPGRSGSDFPDRVSDVDLADRRSRPARLAGAGFHGSMDYMAAHGTSRAAGRAGAGTLRVITARMDYLPRGTRGLAAIEWLPGRAAQAARSGLCAGARLSQVLRARLQQLADRLTERVGPFGYRVHRFGPRAGGGTGARAGLGWRGKHTSLALSRDAGSMFFLARSSWTCRCPSRPPSSAHCGSCSACLDVCPDRAIVAPYRLDARRCISYLTIEHDGPSRWSSAPRCGNRIYGCDDCQLACPWNKFANTAVLPDF